MTDSENIKAFECCHTLSSDCLSCPFLEDSKACASVSLSALALIRELTDENETLRGLYEHNSQLAIDSERKLEQCKKSYEDELSRAHMLLSMAWESVEAKDKLLGTIKADTVRKFADYLKKKSFCCDPGNWMSFDAIDVDELDNHVKGFLEENK